jgi:hypothetical protein
VINEMNDTPALLRSTQDNRNHWVLIHLEGTKSNRSAIGARVSCVTGSLSQIDEIRSGGSFFSQNDFRLHFGLGTASRIDLLEIRWPSGTTERLRNLESDRVISIKEGSGVVSR